MHWSWLLGLSARNVQNGTTFVTRSRFFEEFNSFQLNHEKKKHKGKRVLKNWSKMPFQAHRKARRKSSRKVHQNANRKAQQKQTRNRENRKDHRKIKRYPKTKKYEKQSQKKSGSPSPYIFKGETESWTKCVSRIIGSDCIYKRSNETETRTKSE